jgi:hypothetical protein
MCVRGGGLGKQVQLQSVCRCIGELRCRCNLCLGRRRRCIVGCDTEPKQQHLATSTQYNRNDRGVMVCSPALLAAQQVEGHDGVTVAPPHVRKVRASFLQSHQQQIH